MGIAGILLASQVKPGGMFDPQKIIGQLQGKPSGQAHGQGYGSYNGQQQYQQANQYNSHQGYGQPQYGKPQQPAYGAPQAQAPASYGQPSYTAVTTASMPGAPIHAPHSPAGYGPGGGGGGGYYQQQTTTTTTHFPTPQHHASTQPPPVAASYSMPAPAMSVQSTYGTAAPYASPPPAYAGYNGLAPYSGSENYYGKGVGTVIGVGAAAYGVHQLAQHHKLPFGASHVNAGPNAASNQQYILQCLIQCVQDQNIHPFYPPGTLEPLAQHIASSGAIQRIATEWNMRPEVALDLVRLALFDVVLYIDDSGSMKFEEHGTRMDDLRLLVQRATAAATLFDTDGISVRFINSDRTADHLSTAPQALDFVSNGSQYSGMTAIGCNLSNKILEPMLLQPARQQMLKKPLLVICITDGEPTGEDRSTFVNVVRHARDQLAMTRYGPDALSIELAQVGSDRMARAFLQQIDEDPSVGRMIDVTSDYEHEAEQWQKVYPQIQLNPELYVLKLLLGAVDAAMDRRDEGPQTYSHSPY
ncbi:hypothetical protein OIV83_002609 [Microbotryomycetes sp. JL201]|nr:hypothetical protein OIV83_002609 [Microbotryomycetes sp. JL201]